MFQRYKEIFKRLGDLYEDYSTAKSSVMQKVVHVSLSNQGQVKTDNLFNFLY